MNSDIREYVSPFTNAASALAERMFADVQARDPELAAKVAVAVEHGHCLRISFTVGDAPVIELSTVDDYMHPRVIASIQASSGPQH